jgi:hypothetical protein
MTAKKVKLSEYWLDYKIAAIEAEFVKSLDELEMYRRRFSDKPADIVYMIGLGDLFDKISRLYTIIHTLKSSKEWIRGKM